MQATALQPVLTQAFPASASFSRGMIEAFLDDIDRPEVTAKSYRNCLSQFFNWLDAQGIQYPDKEDIREYRDYLDSIGLAATTKAQYIRTLKQFFSWTAANGYYENIAATVNGAKVRRDIHRRDALDRNGVRKVAGSIDRTTEQGKRLFAIYMLSVTAGLRCVEISRANKEDLEESGDRCYLNVQGKGHDEKDAKVLIVPQVKAAIDDYLNSRTDHYTGKSPLFVSTSNNSKGGRLAPNTIGQDLKKAMKAAGYDSTKIVAHSLRHSSATAVYKATKDINETKEHQRHANISTTEIYIQDEERETRNTEQIAFDYYFSDNETAIYTDRLADMVKDLTGTQAQAVIEFIEDMKGGAVRG